MIRVDFYHLAKGPLDKIITMLAARSFDAGARLTIFDQSYARLEQLSEGLWSAAPDRFLANGIYGKFDVDDAKRQPILLMNLEDLPDFSLASFPANAREGTLSTPALDDAASFQTPYYIYAHGGWVEPSPSAQRIFIPFTDEERGKVRAVWRHLSQYNQDEKEDNKAGASYMPHYWRFDYTRRQWDEIA